MDSKEIPSEPLPRSGSVLSDIAGENKELENNVNINTLSEEELFNKVETYLLDKIKEGTSKQALFQLAQFYFEQELYEKALKFFERAVKEHDDVQSKYQLGIMYYDGLGCKQDCKQGYELMKEVAECKSSQGKHLLRPAQYNLGRAHFQGYGVRPQSDSEAERWWLLAADDGNPKASVIAQTMLGMFYSREETKDLKKAFFWHSEACGNGSLESQGALGVMYENGLGVKKDESAAFECLKEAGERGNVFALGLLVAYYYRKKLFTKSSDLAARVALLRDVESIATETNCLPSYIRKGISMACFYYARALEKGQGLEKSPRDAEKMYSKAYHMDPDMCARLQNITQHGHI